VLVTAELFFPQSVPIINEFEIKKELKKSDDLFIQ